MNRLDMQDLVKSVLKKPLEALGAFIRRMVGLGEGGQSRAVDASSQSGSSSSISSRAVEQAEEQQAMPSIGELAKMPDGEFKKFIKPTKNETGKVSKYEFVGAEKTHIMNAVKSDDLNERFSTQVVLWRVYLLAAEGVNRFLLSDINAFRPDVRLEGASEDLSQEMHRLSKDKDEYLQGLGSLDDKNLLKQMGLQSLDILKGAVDGVISCNCQVYNSDGVEQIMDGAELHYAKAVFDGVRESADVSARQEMDTKLASLRSHLEEAEKDGNENKSRIAQLGLELFFNAPKRSVVQDSPAVTSDDNDMPDSGGDDFDFKLDIDDEN